jgi:hypothetical protein
MSRSAVRVRSSAHFSAYLSRILGVLKSFDTLLGALDTTEVLAEGCFVLVNSVPAPRGHRVLCCLTLVPVLQPSGASSRCVIGNLYTQQAHPECPDGKARLNQPGRAVYLDVSIHGFA